MGLPTLHSSKSHSAGNITFRCIHGELRTVISGVSGKRAEAIHSIKCNSKSGGLSTVAIVFIALLVLVIAGALGFFAWFAWKKHSGNSSFVLCWF